MNRTSNRPAQLEAWLERTAGQREPLECLRALIRPADQVLELPPLGLCSPTAGASLRLYLEFARVQFARLGEADAEKLSGESIVRLYRAWLIAQALGERDTLVGQLDQTEDWLEGVIYGRRRVSS